MTGKPPFPRWDIPPDLEGEAQLGTIQDAVHAALKAEFDRRDLELLTQLREPLCALSVLTSAVPPATAPSPVEMLATMRRLLMERVPSPETPFVVVSLDVPFDDHLVRIPGSFLSETWPVASYFYTGVRDRSPAKPLRDVVLCSVGAACCIHSKQPLDLLRILSSRTGLYDVALNPNGHPPWPPFA